MERTLQLVGKTSNEIFMLRYPRSVLNFCDYDLAYFAENAIAVCNDALKSGELDYDRVTDLRNSLKDAHVYIEHHIRTVYDKIVLDCWIDYVCRRDNVGTSTLWNRFIGCNTAFEKSVFMRLCDFRYNKAINEWLNLVRVQDYAKNKISFIFSKNLKGADEAAARRNYFDLIFSVTARELGCRIEELGVTKVFSVGRLPSAPFMFPNISKDIVKNVLADFDYSDDYSDSEGYGDLSDQIAMDAFSHMKAGLSQEFDSYNISRSQMENSPLKVYMPCGLKAAVDLEIDALIESGGWLARCKRCGRYYLRDSEHTEEYCSLLNPGGKTCLEIYELEHPRTKISPELERRCREITDMMYGRVDRSMSLHEYESWKKYLDAMKQKVENDEIPVEELSEFINYSRSLDLSRSNPVLEVPKKEPEYAKERVVKPFVPERIQRSDIPAPVKKQEEDPEEYNARKEGFFTSPIVQRQKSERAPISHIIRAGEQRSDSVTESFVPSDTFMQFGEQPRDNAPSAPTERTAPHGGFTAFGEQPRDNAPSAPTERTAPHGFTAFGEQPRDNAPSISNENRGSEVNSVGYERGEAPKSDSGAADMPQAAKPRTKVIRKNAAAISAYGKIAGAQIVNAPPQLEKISRPDTEEAPVKPKSAEGKETERVNADPDPFKEVGSIFDVLEQSETDMSGLTSSGTFDNIEEAGAVQPVSEHKPKKRSARRKQEPEPVPEWEAEKTPEKVTAENAPSGIWTEERHLFPDSEAEQQSSEEQSELTMLKEKKRGRTSKTQHLFDAIMREPEDNPNFRKR